MRIKEIRELPQKDLESKVKELKEELFVSRFQQATGSAKDSSKRKEIRKDIARILTVIKEREQVNG
ncbi:MAG: 50S ribosomal protein L29 [Bacilli bacterium]|jgi:large subunit ribosomal protein L29|nr:50S ribosomal protein L29 [Bacilli bacterium]MDD3422172.1 50S ribosomal protein L29 [Bacilli bacterium]MDD4065880.1 50S ribosomal protein L29 [Bacilli bacterium]